MQIPFVDLRRQYEQLKPEIDAAMAEVMAETAFIGTRGNRFVEAFEEEFKDYAGAGHCVACANGTDALEILLRAAGIGAGDEVIVPAISWIATSEAVSNAGGRPVFADVSAHDGTIDPQAVERLIGPRTWGVIPVHLYGAPADLDPIMELAARHDLFVLEDCAQAHGARYKGRKIGTIGHAGSFSFFPGKNLGAYGDAGGMITSDADLARRARMIGQHGQAGAKFQHEMEGRNSRLDGLQAAVLSVKLRHLEAWTLARIALADEYRRRLAGLALKLPAAPGDSRHVYHLFAIRVEGRDALRAELSEVGIPTGMQYPVPLPLLEAYAERGHGPQEFPCSVELADSVLTLPIYPELDADQMEHIVTEVRNRCGIEGR